MDERHYYAGMFDGESASEALERIDRWERSMADRAEQAQTLARRAAAMSATARSGDGLVQVTVGPEGQIERLELAEQTRQQPASATARQIMETITAAKSKLIFHFAAVAEETVGTDTETGRMLMTSLRKRLAFAQDDSEPKER
jgi:DNA-binding protein YbaB